MSKIKVAIVGVGHCASSLVQGIYHYIDEKPDYAIGLKRVLIGCKDGSLPRRTASPKKR